MCSLASGASMAATVLQPLVRALSRYRSAEREAALGALDAVLARENLSLPRVMSQRTLRLPHALCVEMLETAIAVTADPALGLRAAASSRPGDLELLEYLVRNCETAGEMIEMVRRYLPLVIDAQYEVLREGRWLVARLRFAPELRVTPAVTDFALTHIAHTAMRYLERPPGRVELHLRHARPSYAAEYQRFLGVEPRFDCAHNAFLFSPELERARLRGSDPVLLSVLLRQAEAELRSLPRQRDWTTRVRDAIERALPRGAPLTEVARELGCSEATLRRRLQARDTSYRVLLEQVRRDLSARHLEAGELSVSEIADRLGFGRASAFHRAFKRWHGRSPTEYRAARQQPSALRDGTDER